MSRLTVKDAVSGKDINNLLEANNENQTGAADAYMLAIGGKTYSQYKKEREERRKEYDRWEEEYKAKIPALTKIWIDEGHKVLSEDKWQMWNECVPIRLGDLYKGIELGQCLDIIRTVKEKSIADGIEVMKKQDHSGLS